MATHSRSSETKSWKEFLSMVWIWLSVSWLWKYK